MKAPSEKHLEDWIVANYGLVSYEDDFGDGPLDIGLIGPVIARQVRLPAGRADLVTYGSDDRAPNVAVVELKQGVIKSDTVAQCLRYMRDLHEIFYWLEPGSVPASYEKHGLADQISGYEPEVSGIVIGHSLSDSNLLIACEAAHIRVVLYDFDGEQYSFEQASESVQLPSYHERYLVYQEFGFGAIGEAFRTIMRHPLRNRSEHGSAT